MKQSEIMSKRVFLTLPDEVVDDLERWADKQGRAVANLAAYLVEFSVQQAKERGEIPQKQNAPDTGKSK